MLVGTLAGKCDYYCCHCTSPPLPPLQLCNGFWGWGISSFKSDWLCWSNLDNARVVFTCISVGGWTMLIDGGHINDLAPLSKIYVISILGSWYPPGIGVGCSGKALGMGSGIVGALSFLRNLRSCKVILPDSSNLIQYWWLERVSVTQPVVWVLWHCIETICPF